MLGRVGDNLGTGGARTIHELRNIKSTYLAPPCVQVKQVSYVNAILKREHQAAMANPVN